jgi:hypothetical protein
VQWVLELFRGEEEEEEEEEEEGEEERVGEEVGTINDHDLERTSRKAVCYLDFIVWGTSTNRYNLLSDKIWGMVV